MQPPLALTAPRSLPVSHPVWISLGGSEVTPLMCCHVSFTSEGGAGACRSLPPISHLPSRQHTWPPHGAARTCTGAKRTPTAVPGWGPQAQRSLLRHPAAGGTVGTVVRLALSPDSQAVGPGSRPAACGSRRLRAKRMGWKRRFPRPVYQDPGRYLQLPSAASPAPGSQQQPPRHSLPARGPALQEHAR